MDFKLIRENFTAKDVVLDSAFEQSIETDYILPDYYPDIFRIVKCRALPNITSYTVVNGKLTYEMSVCVKVMYLSENSNALNCFEQKLNYTKSVDLQSPSDCPSATLIPKLDYVNCRVVNQRRIDIRGAVSVKTKVCCEKKQQVVADASGCGIQLKKSIVTYPSKRSFVTKRISVVEEIETGASKPEIKSIIRADASVISADKKLVSGKIMVKGEAEVSILYTCVKDEHDSMETMKFTLPFSQIIDVDGLDEKFECFIEASASGCDIILKSGSPQSFECELNINISCTAIKFETAELVTDVYSTMCECEFTALESKLECVPVAVKENHQSKISLTYQEGSISCVYDAFAEISNVSGRYSFDDSRFVVSGSVKFCVFASNENGCPIYLEGDIPFEHNIPGTNAGKDSYIEPTAEVCSCSYTLTSDNTVEITAEIKICGYLYEAYTKLLITDISVNSSSKKEQPCSCALKLYYADKGEEIWDIAKKYSAPLSAVVEENGLDCEKLPQCKMLLIPMSN